MFAEGGWQGRGKPECQVKYNKGKWILKGILCTEKNHEVTRCRWGGAGHGNKSKGAMPIEWNRNNGIKLGCTFFPLSSLYQRHPLYNKWPWQLSTQASLPPMALCTPLLNRISFHPSQEDEMSGLLKGLTGAIWRCGWLRWTLHILDSTCITFLWFLFACCCQSPGQVAKGGRNIPMPESWTEGGRNIPMLEERGTEEETRPNATDTHNTKSAEVNWIYTICKYYLI